jgi:hypothetical protein
MSYPLPGRYDIEIFQSGTFRLDLILKAGGEPVNLNGYGVFAGVYDNHHRELFATMTLYWIDRANGEIMLKIPAATTQLITESGQWRLMVTEPSGDKYPWLVGSACLSK